MGTQCRNQWLLPLRSRAAHRTTVESRFARVKSRCRGGSFVWLEEFMLGLSAHLGIYSLANPSGAEHE